MEIKISCQGADTLPLAEFKDFQGDLKTITPENLEKLKRSILKHGFTAPIFVWDNAGVKNILDGHQRLKALVDLQSEGFHVPDLPVVYVYADNEKDAKEKLLYITSQYGKTEIDNVTDFAKGIDIDFSEIDIPYVTFGIENEIDTDSKSHYDRFDYRNDNIKFEFGAITAYIEEDVYAIFEEKCPNENIAQWITRLVYEI